MNLKCQLLTKLKAAAFSLNSDINIFLKQTLNITMSQFLVSSRCILPYFKSMKFYLDDSTVRLTSSISTAGLRGSSGLSEGASVLTVIDNCTFNTEMDLSRSIHA